MHKSFATLLINTVIRVQLIRRGDPVGDCLIILKMRSLHRAQVLVTPHSAVFNVFA